MSSFQFYHQTDPIAGLQLSDDDAEEQEQEQQECEPVSVASPVVQTSSSSHNYCPQTTAMAMATGAAFNGRRTKKGETEWVIEPVQGEDEEDDEGLIVANAVQAVPSEPSTIATATTTTANNYKSSGAIFSGNELPQELLESLADEGFEVNLGQRKRQRQRNPIISTVSAPTPTSPPTVLGTACATSAPPPPRSGVVTLSTAPVPVVMGIPKPPPTVQGSPVTVPINMTSSPPTNPHYNSASTTVPDSFQFRPSSPQYPYPPPAPAPSIVQPGPTTPTFVKIATITSIKPPHAVASPATTTTTTIATDTATSTTKTSYDHPPGTPAGGRWVLVKHAGASTWTTCGVIGVVGCLFGGVLGLCGFWALLCPCDWKHAYMAEDGSIYDPNGRRIGHRDRTRWR